MQPTLPVGEVKPTSSVIASGSSVVLEVVDGGLLDACSTLVVPTCVKVDDDVAAGDPWPPQPANAPARTASTTTPRRSDMAVTIPTSIPLEFLVAILGPMSLRANLR